MLSPRIKDAFNQQLNAEFASSYLYLSMSAYFASKNLSGMAHWMRVQAQEELGHVEKFFDFINERSGRVVLTAIEAPEAEWDSALDAFQSAHQHESKISGLIGTLLDLSAAEKDHAAEIFLQWFVTEQIEEEATVEAIVANLSLAGDSGVALLMLDKELGARSLPLPDKV